LKRTTEISESEKIFEKKPNRVEESKVGKKRSWIKKKFRKTLYFLLISFLVLTGIYTLANFLTYKADKYVNVLRNRTFKWFMLIKAVDVISSVGEEVEIQFGMLGVDVDFPIGEVLEPIEETIDFVSDAIQWLLIGTFSVSAINTLLKDQAMIVILLGLLVFSGIVKIWIPGFWERAFEKITNILVGILTVKIGIICTVLAVYWMDSSFFAQRVKQSYNILEEFKSKAGRILSKSDNASGVVSGATTSAASNVKISNYPASSSMSGASFSTAVENLWYKLKNIGNVMTDTAVQKITFLKDKMGDSVELFKLLWKSKQELIIALSKIAFWSVVQVIFDFVLIPLTMLWFVHALLFSVFDSITG